MNKHLILLDRLIKILNYEKISDIISSLKRVSDIINLFQ